MEKISGVSDDELLVKILSFVPTKVAVSTSVLSKWWKYLWKRVPKLEFSNIDTKPSNKWQKRLRRFIQRNLPLHEAPVLESLHLKFSTHPFQPEDIESWIEIARSRGVHELSIAYSPTSEYYLITILPSSLYTCKSLVSLKLEDKVYVEVPHSVYFPFLKTFLLRLVVYQCEKSLQQLLSNCPVLEDLTVEQCVNDNAGGFSVIIPSLQRLSIKLPKDRDSDKVVIKSPSLKYFKVIDQSSPHSLRFIDAMYELEEADIDIKFWNIRKFVYPVTSVKRLSLCLTVGIPKPVAGRVGIIFHKLEHLKLCTCDIDWSNLLFRFLRDSQLRHLELY